jgi:hypothetical protein
LAVSAIAFTAITACGASSGKPAAARRGSSAAIPSATPAVAAPSTAVCDPVLHAVTDVASKAGISLVTGSMKSNVTRAKRFSWGAELAAAYPKHLQGLTAADVDLT